MTMPLVSRTEAMGQRTHHQYIQGIGYLKHSGPPDMPASARGNKNCAPAQGTKDDSRHLLKPPNGAPPMTLKWVAKENAWAPMNPAKGNRLAWPTSHLQRAGWEYIGAA